MRWTGRLLIVLVLSSLGCVRGDWISQTLTLVDVTGTWTECSVLTVLRLVLSNGRHGGYSNRRAGK